MFTIWDGIHCEQKDKMKWRRGKKKTEIRDTKHPQMESKKGNNGISDNISREKENENMKRRKGKEKHLNPFGSFCIWLWCHLIRIYKWVFQMKCSDTFQFTNQLIEMSGYL